MWGKKNNAVTVRIPKGLMLSPCGAEEVQHHHHHREGGKMRKFSCHFCPYTSDYRAKLSRHMRLHTGERPFQCEVCGRAFTRKDHLQKHLPTHDGRFKEPESAGGFLGSLLTISTQHPYRCKLCGRGFIQKHHYERHAKTHDESFVDY